MTPLSSFWCWLISFVWCFLCHLCLLLLLCSSSELETTLLVFCFFFVFLEVLTLSAILPELSSELSSFFHVSVLDLGFSLPVLFSLFSFAYHQHTWMCTFYWHLQRLLLVSQWVFFIFLYQFCFPYLPFTYHWHISTYHLYWHL